MNYLLPTTYLIILSAILGIIIIFLATQIIKKRELESTLTSLQNKMRNSIATDVDYYELGVIYLSKKLFDQAILQFRMALKNWDTKDTQGLANLHNTIGFTYFETKQYDLAIYYYSQAVKYMPNYIVALNNLAYAYEKKQMLKEAIKIYKEVIYYQKDNEIAKEKLEKLLKLAGSRDDRI